MGSPYCSDPAVLTRGICQRYNAAGCFLRRPRNAGGKEVDCRSKALICPFDGEKGTGGNVPPLLNAHGRSVFAVDVGDLRAAQVWSSRRSQW